MSHCGACWVAARLHTALKPRRVLFSSNRTGDNQEVGRASVRCVPRSRGLARHLAAAASRNWSITTVRRAMPRGSSLGSRACGALSHKSKEIDDDAAPPQHRGQARAFQRCTSPAASAAQSLGPGSAATCSLGFKALATTTPDLPVPGPADMASPANMLQHLRRWWSDGLPIMRILKAASHLQCGRSGECAPRG